MNTLNTSVTSNNMEVSSETLRAASETSAIVDYSSFPDYGKFCAYDAQLPIAEVKGTRIVRCLYKATKKDGKLVPSKFANSYVRIPVRHLNESSVIENAAKLAPFVVSYLQSIEDGMIKELHKKGSLNVYVNSLSLDAIIAELEETSDSGRLNADKINTWFEDCLLENLAAQFAERLGVNDASSEADFAKLEAVCLAYKNKFASLAGGKTFLPENDIKAMLNVMIKCDSSEGENYLSGKIKARLENMMKKDEELLLAL